MQNVSSGFNTRFILRVSFISALGGYLFGFDFAVIAGALPFLKASFSFNEYWEGFATASLALGCMVGCVFAGRLADQYGRRPALMLAAAIFLLSSLVMAFAGGKLFFVCCRLVAGIGVGMASTLSPLYIAEIAPAESRGRMVAINQLTIVLGILVTNIVNYLLRNSGDDAWRWMVGLGAVPSAFFLAGVYWLPESPRWLLKAGEKEKALKVLVRLGGSDYANEVVAKSNARKTQEVKSSYKAVFSKAVLPALLVGMTLAVFQQLCGINVVFNFATTIFESVGFSQDDQLKQTIFIGVVNLVFTVLAMWQVDKAGRKPLMLLGAGGLAVLYIISAVLLQQKSGLAAWTLLASIGVYAMSLAPVTWVLIAEIFPMSVRGAAVSVSVLALWLAYAILVFTFPILASRLGTYTPFYIYAGICVAGFFFIYKKVRETNGTSLDDIEEAAVPAH
ncbi:sugar porter (SP) family MFS transporter [Filimonas zeae]|uniref:MFS transporter n=1 Tax=Filimonas zeae TaxID=1737353 RepID=A0A917IQ82_9BACT|nr:sugar porter family MFS transporter [Filimonas zeae]MDR6337622.1 sugar porter (SP) family MFS transporter [Filimonas zeae]GGH59505.1 MFS transporter [Filimonas zeae]